MNKKGDHMDCGHCMNKMDDYIDGKLMKEDLLSFEQHLQSCRECSAHLRLVKLSEKVISHEKSLSPGYFLTEKVMARIEKTETKEESPVVRILRPALLTLSVAAAIFAGVMIGNISKAPSGFQAPVELTLMNDMQIESIDVLATD
jgi:anti-sigma factor RsiW